MLIKCTSIPAELGTDLSEQLRGTPRRQQVGTHTGVNIVDACQLERQLPCTRQVCGGQVSQEGGKRLRSQNKHTQDQQDLRRLAALGLHVGHLLG